MIVEFYGTYTSFFRAALLGAFFGILYDVFRIVRISHLPYIMPSGKFYEIISIPQRERHTKTIFWQNFFKLSNTVITLVEDLLFWAIASLCEILFIYHVNGGAIRIYFLVISFAIAAIYFLTIGKLTIYFSVRIIFLIRCLLYWIFYIIIYPIRRILSLLIRFTRFIQERIIKPKLFKITHKKELKYSEKRLAEILANAESGFLVYRSKVNEKKAKKNIA